MSAITSMTRQIASERAFWRLAARHLHARTRERCSFGEADYMGSSSRGAPSRGEKRYFEGLSPPFLSRSEERIRESGVGRRGRDTNFCRKRFLVSKLAFWNGGGRERDCGASWPSPLSRLRTRVKYLCLSPPLQGSSKILSSLAEGRSGLLGNHSKLIGRPLRAKGGKGTFLTAELPQNWRLQPPKGDE